MSGEQRDKRDRPQGVRVLESQDRAQRRRVVYLEQQKEEAERAAARMKLEKAQAIFAQDQRRSLRPTLATNLGDKLRAAGFGK